MGKSFSSRDIIKILESDGWYLIYARGSHHYFVHPTKPNKIPVPHPKKHIPIGTYKSIMKQAGL